MPATFRLVLVLVVVLVLGLPTLTEKQTEEDDEDEDEHERNWLLELEPWDFLGNWSLNIGHSA